MLLSSAANIKQLTLFFLEEWQKDKYAPKLLTKRFTLSKMTRVCLTSADGHHTISSEVLELHSSDGEEDTKIILHCFCCTGVVALNDKMFFVPNSCFTTLL